MSGDWNDKNKNDKNVKGIILLQSVPCNLEMDSKAVEDACGVCHGDGSTCEFSQGIQFFERIEKSKDKRLKSKSYVKKNWLIFKFQLGRS